MKPLPLKSWAVGALVSLSFLVSGCRNYSDLLARGQSYYEQNQYETALAVLRQLESDQGALDATEIVRYCYLRGMTDYRLGYRADARYWLGLAMAASRDAGGALLEDEAARLDETLSELSDEVYGLPQEPVAQVALGESCQWSSDCDAGYTCVEGVCIQADTSD